MSGFFMRGGVLMMVLAGAAASPAAAPDGERLKPYVLANTWPGGVEQVAAGVRGALKSQGFEEVGSYSPYSGAIVIVVTNPELKGAAVRARNGGFGAGQRVAVTDYQGKVQVSYVNPRYIGAAYGLGPLNGVADRLRSALGAVQEFGSERGLTAAELAPGVYHYFTGLPYFQNVDFLATHDNYRAAVAAVEAGLAAGQGGTKKVYRIDLPGNDVSVFGVAIVTGDGVNKGEKDTDKEVMDVVDGQALRRTAYLPYELMVQGGEVIALRAKYRIALHFPDMKMMGAHGFARIMSASTGIKTALAAAAGSKARR